MQYILTQEEKDNLVSRTDLENKSKELDFVVSEFKKSWGCVPYYKCYKCPISIVKSRYNACKEQSYGK